ncbi:hypothetical protein H0E87_024248 [Populus deltoides]|uniref:Uncharacterized protein n=1 Tax=Populus deltoides TaxID=3696 RepID=A0A8T2X4I6_POPDE|nr:hypothetical protein H0E87_024248 [Populus deltoides]KAH8488506.1 hypothetical protein H0E87_024248 [Populus deltoides]
MGGKGRRRREKNYRAAHGGSHSLLPPPPKSSQVDALPSKLRKLISLTSQLHDDSAKNSMSGQENTKQQVGDAKKKRAHEEGNEATMVKDEGVEEIVEGSGDEKRKKKKKKKQVNDLRFEMGLHKSKTVEKRRERKKNILPWFIRRELGRAPNTLGILQAWRLLVPFAIDNTGSACD